jgi:predicted nucleic acid-binding protein
MSAGDSFFVDTNVLLYRFSSVGAEKQLAAAQWIAALWSLSSGRLSWQVIFEFYVNVVRKTGTPAATAREAASHLVLWNPVSPHHATLTRAWHWCDKAQINFWDALIVAAAEQSGSRWLLSEDFQTGRKFDSVTVVNPFEKSPSEFGLA